MTLKEYFKSDFQNDFLKLKFDTDCFGNNFFGGYEWENYDNDIKKIKDENRKNFIFSLFLTQLCQTCINCYFPEIFEKYYKTMPAFGYHGFGPHRGDVQFILNVPAEKGILFNDDDFVNIVKDFFEQCQEDCQKLKIDERDFFSKIYGDSLFKNTRKGKNSEISTPFYNFVKEFDLYYQKMK